MKTLTISDDMSWNDLQQHLGEEDVLIMRDGNAVALVIPFDEDDLQWYARERAPAFLESIARARQQVAAGAIVRHAELREQLGVD